MGERQWLGCNCYSPDHYLCISTDFDDDDVRPEQRLFSIITGNHWMPFRIRFREALNVLRGRPRFYAETLLNVSDATKLNDTLRAWLDDIADEIERNKQP